MTLRISGGGLRLKSEAARECFKTSFVAGVNRLLYLSPLYLTHVLLPRYIYPTPVLALPTVSISPPCFFLSFSHISTQAPYPKLLKVGR